MAKIITKSYYQCSACSYYSEREDDVIRHEADHECMHTEVQARLEFEEHEGDHVHGGYDSYAFSIERSCKQCYKMVERSSILVTGFDKSDFVDELEQLIKKHGNTWKPEIVNG